MDLEKLIRELIMAGGEGNKVDLKSETDFKSNEGRMRLAKLISAIANTDDPLYGNCGYIVFGAKRGEILGGMEALSEDNVSASVNQSINAFLDPQVRFNIRTFKDGDNGVFAVFAISPSTPQERPHFIAKDGNDGKSNIYKGQCFVRYGDRIELAQRSDYERLYAARYQQEINRLRSMLEERDQQRPNADVVVKSESGLAQSCEAKVVSYTERPDIEERVQKERDRYLNPPRPYESLGTGAGAFIVASYLSNPLLFPSQQYDPQEVERYLPLYRKYLQELDKYNDAKAKLYELHLVLHNDGTVPTENLTLILTFPYVVQKIIKDEDAPKKPERPTTPELRSRLESILGPGMHASLYGINAASRMLNELTPVPRLNLHPPNVLGPVIKNREVRFEVKRLPHGLPLELEPLHLSFGSPSILKEGEHSISYVIHADNQQQAKTGQLTMQLKAEEKAWHQFQREQTESFLSKNEEYGDEDDE
jgi:hypothetical protein